MSRLPKFLFALALLSALAFSASFLVESNFTSRAKLTQRVQLPDSSVAELFGGEPTMIGSPQMMIIDDPEAVVPGKGPQGSVLVDDAYLQKTGQYPLQLKTVQFVAQIIRLTSGIAGVMLGLLAWFVRHRQLARA